MNKQGLEQEWRVIQKVLGEKSLLVFPSTIEVGENGVLDIALWKGEQGIESFLDLTNNLGIRLVYAEARCLNQNDIGEIEGRLMLDEETATSQEVNELVNICKTFTGRIAALKIDWRYGNIWHRYSKVADWYEELEDRVSELEARLHERNTQITEGRIESQQNEIEKAAERLAKEHDFQSARGGWLGRRRVAEKIFPEFPESKLGILNSAAWTIYQNEILPEQERAQTKEIRRMLAKEGATRYKVATELGMRPEKLARLSRSKIALITLPN